MKNSDILAILQEFIPKTLESSSNQENALRENARVARRESER
jgi:hypothetical protein